MKLLAKNRRATFDYQINDRLVAGLVLTGAETKSVKSGHASLKGSFVSLRSGEAYLTNAHISPYKNAVNDGDPLRNRKLLLHRRQIDELISQKQSGLSVVPTALLLDKNLVKLEIGIGPGKKHYDKRQAIKERDTARELSRAVR
jgi:SsrA-binding protein